MAQHTVRLKGHGIKLFAKVDPAAIESQEIVNYTGYPLRLTFVKDVVYKTGSYECLEPDNTVPIPEIKAGETYEITAQMISDALAAGNHTDIYEVSAEDFADSTTAENYLTTI
jgi:hypothetical protein